ncbi:divergent polysaccharide deacetylase family protein [Novispirillum itersonii]|uniref:Divergent polysaccharide deacetylase family protein n=1 Tax=Novispirillum itersonii TaxID=189 RepID=A0A7X0DM22_NOVIT|nr:divergent polysaccharide deacetylase family protein [Novispirillum itersonii]MBB6210600.1 hypothetical protein [Novispirillum itersonii]
MSKRVSSPRPTRPQKDTPKIRRTAVRRPRSHGRGTSSGDGGPPSRIPQWIRGLFDRGRPLPLIGLVAGLVIGGIVLGWALGRINGTPPAQTRGLDTVAMDRLVAANEPAHGIIQRPAPMMADAGAEDGEGPATAYESDYGPAVVTPSPLAAGAQPEGGVRLSDPLTAGGTVGAVVSGQVPEAAPVAPAAVAPVAAPMSPAVPVPAPQQHAAVIQKGWKDAALPPPAGAGKKPMIAIVIDDMGIDKGRTARITALPGPITASFLTYASDLKKQAADSRRAGHELMMHVPMQPQGTINAGPDVLRVGMDPDEIHRRMVEYLGRLDGIVGINNHMGSAFTEHAEGLRPVMQVLKDHNLFFLDSKTSGRSVGSKIAAEAGIPTIDRNVFLDHEETSAFVTRQLAETEAIARKHGYAVAIGHPKDVTIKGLSQWLPTLSEKGFVLVPLSTLIRMRSGAG